MLQIYICDDMALMRKKYSTLIRELAQKHRLAVRVTLFASGEELLFSLEEQPGVPDIIYLDVFMGKLSGIETGRMLRKLGCHSQLIFLTASETDVFDAFEAEPLYYILKDKISTEKFEEVLLKAVRLVRNKEQRFFACESGRVKKYIALGSIYYFEVSNRIVTVHFGEGESFSFYSTIDRVQSELDLKQFVRCHRSFIVNLRAVTQLDTRQLTLVNGTTVPVGGAYFNDLGAALSTGETE